MAWPMIAAAAASAAETVGNNLLSEWHADKAQERQKELMSLQDKYNRGLQVSAMSNQVEGAKLAGLNPAMFNGQMSSAQSVGLGSAPKGENVEMNPADLLTMASKNNLDAQTDKLKAETQKISGADTQNVEADTALKIASKLYTGANTGKVKEEAKNIQNINETYAAENVALKDYGKIFGQKMQSFPVYDRLLPDTRATIDAMADGDLPMTVGSMNALSKVIQSQKDLSDADKTLVTNAMANEVIARQLSNDAVMEAISKDPLFKQKLTDAQAKNLEAARKKLEYRMHELIDTEIAGKKLSNTQLDAIIKSFKSNDLGFLKSQGEYGKWLEAYSEELLTHILPAVTGGTVISTVNHKLNKPVEPSRIHKPSDKDIERFGGNVFSDPAPNAGGTTHLFRPSGY